MLGGASSPRRDEVLTPLAWRDYAIFDKEPIRGIRIFTVLRANGRHRDRGRESRRRG
jgi:hypothetical protein